MKYVVMIVVVISLWDIAQQIIDLVREKNKNQKKKYENND